MLFIFMIKPGSGAEKVPRRTAIIFAEFYEQYLPKIYNYVSYRVADKFTAEDLTSTVFEKALAKFNTFDSEKASFSTWLFTIARNTVIDHYRVRSKEQDVENESTVFITVQSNSPEEDLVKEEDRRKLKTCVAQLNKQEQEIISLKFGAEMTNRQIAKMLDISESNVGITLYRSIRKLREGFVGWQK